MIRKIIIALIGIAIIVLSVTWTMLAIAGREAPKKKPKPAAVKYAKTKVVRYQDLPAKIEATGRLRSFNKTSIFSEVQGQIIAGAKKLKVGTRFNKGETIIKVDPSQAKLDLYSSKSTFLSLLSSVMADIKADHQNDFKVWDNYLKDFDIERPIEKLPEVQNKQLKYFLSNRNIFKTYYDIKNLELRLEKHFIKAPFSCVIIASNIDEGGLVMPGQMLATIAEIGNYELELSVPAMEAEFVNIGSKVIAGNEANPKKWEGRIIRKAGNIDPGTQTIKVFAMISGNGLMDGMYLDADIYGKEIQRVFEIDRSSLVNAESLYYLNDKRELDQMNIEIVLQSKEIAYIRGIDSNLVVIDQPLANVALGTKIIPVEEDKKESM